MKNEKKILKDNKPAAKKKTDNTTIKEMRPVKVVTFFRDTFTLMNTPVTNTMIEKISEEYLSWARNDDWALRVDQFFHLKGIPPKTFYRWIKEFPLLDEAHDAVLSLIAIRRELGVCIRDTKSGNTKLTRDALTMMHHYDDNWKKGMEWRAQITQKENADTNITVVMDTVASSPLVPEKKKVEQD